MSTVLTFDAITPVAPEGEAPFEVKRVYLEKNIATKWGLRNRAAVEFTLDITNEEGLFETVTIKSRYLISNHESSKFYKLVLDALDRLIGKRI